MAADTEVNSSQFEEDDGERMSPFELLVPLAQNWKTLVLGPIVVGLLAYGGTYIVKPTYTAGVTLLPPQSSQSALSGAALASLGGALSGIAAGAAGLRTPADQYAALLQTAAVRDQLIDEFKLLDVYQSRFRQDAMLDLSKRVRVVVGKKDGMISIEVDDESPKRASDLANRHVDLLRALTAKLALTEAQQRRVFFEAQLQRAKSDLTEAQRALAQSGFNPGALRAEPRATADAYARLKAETTAMEVRLQGLRRSLTDNAPEVQQLMGSIGIMRAQLATMESGQTTRSDSDYIERYRNFKYQEVLLEMFARQFELARLDESREGALIQVVDAAKIPEKRTSPKRRIITLGAVAGGFILLAGWFLTRHLFARAAADPVHAQSLRKLKSAVLRGG
jgi:uncharacterized protein involved in exopolysaccharide biosynthesis